MDTHNPTTPELTCTASGHWVPGSTANGVSHFAPLPRVFGILIDEMAI
jgi:hypothetical protein